MAVIVNAFELGPIRPPSEAQSLLLRFTRNCPWNRCRFCHTYKTEKFELRPLAEIKEEILSAGEIYRQIMAAARQRGLEPRDMAENIADSPPSPAHRDIAVWMYFGAENVFLQDGNTIIMRTPELLEALDLLKKELPSIQRITSYGRSHTAARKTADEFKQLHEAGLSRVHIGLETGYDALLKTMEKGVTAAEHVRGGKNIVASGISLSEYVLLGLGGKTMSREHALETARVLNEINPDYIRFRTLSLTSDIPLYRDWKEGLFTRASEEDIVAEERLLLEHLNVTSHIVSDHITNLLQEIEGKLPEDKDKLTGIIDRFLSLPVAEKVLFKIGRRMNLFYSLDDLSDAIRRAAAENFIRRITANGSPIDDNVIYRLTEHFI